MAIEIEITKLPGNSRQPVAFCPSSDYPGMLWVLGFDGLRHGDVFGFDAANRAKLRQWLDEQDKRERTDTQEG